MGTKGFKFYAIGFFVLFVLLVLYLPALTFLSEGVLKAGGWFFALVLLFLFISTVAYLWLAGSKIKNPTLRKLVVLEVALVVLAIIAGIIWNLRTCC